MNRESRRNNKFSKIGHGAQKPDDTTSNGNPPSGIPEKAWSSLLSAINSLQASIAEIGADYKKQKAANAVDMERQAGVAEGQLRTAIKLNVITLAGVVVSVAALIFIYGSLVATKEATVSANRAWLWPENFNIEIVSNVPIPSRGPPVSIVYSGNDPGLGKAIGEEVQKNANTPLISITGDTQNVGREAATDAFVSKDFYFGFATAEIPYPHDIPIKDACSSTIDALRSGPSPHSSAIFATQKLNYEKAIPTSQTNADDIRNGAKAFYFGDCMTYKTFRTIHNSPFCFYLMKDFKTGSLRIYRCPVGNNAD